MNGPLATRFDLSGMKPILKRAWKNQTIRAWADQKNSIKKIDIVTTSCDGSSTKRNMRERDIEADVSGSQARRDEQRENLALAEWTPACLGSPGN